MLAECEQDKYGNNLVDAARALRRPADERAPFRTPRPTTKASWPGCRASLPRQRGQADLLARVADACFYRSGVLSITNPDAVVLAKTSLSADPAEQPLAVALQFGLGRLVVFADSDLFGDDSIDDYDHLKLWTNASPGRPRVPSFPARVQLRPGCWSTRAGST